MAPSAPATAGVLALQLLPRGALSVPGLLSTLVVAILVIVVVRVLLNIALKIAIVAAVVVGLLWLFGLLRFLPFV
jgi:type IV secretory pathway VirB2 component (pilin)